MNNRQPWTKVDRRLVTAPIPLGGRTVELVARLSGRLWAGDAATASHAGALVRIEPVALIVREGDETRSIPIEDPVRAPGKGLAVVAGAVSLGCMLIMFVAHRLSNRR